MSQSDTTFEFSLQAALLFYGVRADVTGLKQTYLAQQTPLMPEDAERLLMELSFRLVRMELDFDALLTVEAPALVQRTVQGYAAWLPDRFGRPTFYIPGAAPVYDMERMRAEYAGSAYVLVPEHEHVTLKAKQAGKDLLSRRHAIDWFWDPIRQYRRDYSEVLICSLFINLFALVMPLFTMNVYDRVVPNFATATLTVLTIGVICMFLFDFALKTVRGYVLDKMASRLGTRYDGQLMERLLMLSATQNKMSVGEKAHLFRELQGIREFYALRLAPALIDMPFFLLFLLVIYYISPPLTLVPLIGAVIVLAINASAWMVAARVNHQAHLAQQAGASNLVEMLNGLDTVRLFNAIGNRLFRYRMHSESAAQKARRSAFIMGAISNLSGLVVYLVQVFVVVWGVYEIHAGNLTTGGLIAISILGGRVMAPVINLASVIAKYKQSRDVLLSIDKLFRVPHEGDKLRVLSAKGPFVGALTLSEVNFQYKGQPRPALQRVSLSIAPGEKVGLIGRSGAGKSTLSQILAGTLKPDSGNVFLDRYLLDAISPAELRRTIGVVPQTAFFFAGSIRDNLLLGEVGVTQAQIDEAVAISGLDLVMEQNGYGLDAEVGENGAFLSSGQRQALSLARTLIRAPQILILDEPTTGMDYVLEDRVRHSLKDYLASRTFIMVTHRTTLLELVDRLVLMDQGQVAADGPRQDIMKKLGGQR